MNIEPPLLCGGILGAMLTYLLFMVLCFRWDKWNG